MGEPKVFELVEWISGVNYLEEGRSSSLPLILVFAKSNYRGFR